MPRYVSLGYVWDMNLVRGQSPPSVEADEHANVERQQVYEGIHAKDEATCVRVHSKKLPSRAEKSFRGPQSFFLAGLPQSGRPEGDKLYFFWLRDLSQLTKLQIQSLRFVGEPSSSGESNR